MLATAAHLTDHVLPPLPVCQWVLAVPKRLRYFLHRDADLQGAALRLFLRAVEQHLREHSPDSGPAARLGTVAFNPPLRLDEQPRWCAQASADGCSYQVRRSSSS
jgi:hypothetical protein